MKPSDKYFRIKELFKMLDLLGELGNFFSSTA
jgi:hypothetical protein